jgi:hypothetical protein
VVGRIEGFEEHFDVALALHACGVATDYALHKALLCRAAYVVCPCCIGKLKFGLKSQREGESESETGSDISEITHPRSRWLSDALQMRAANLTTPPSPPSTAAVTPSTATVTPSTTTTLAAVSASPDELFAAMARAGDISHGEGHSQSTVGQTHLHAHEARLCKCHLELDRNMCMQENGYITALMKLRQAELTGKSELLVGVSSEMMTERGMMFPWQALSVEHC